MSSYYAILVLLFILTVDMATTQIPSSGVSQETSLDPSLTSFEQDLSSNLTDVGNVTHTEATTSVSSSSSSLSLSPVTSTTKVTTTKTTTEETTTVQPTIAFMFHPIYNQLFQRGMQIISEINRVPVPANTMDPGQILSAIMKNVDLMQVTKRSVAQDDIRNVFPKAEGVHQNCYDDVVDFIDGLIGQKQNATSNEYITTDWALKMADAIGKPRAGLLRGTLQMVGSYDECLDIHAKIPNGTYLGSRKTARNKTSQFRARYCRVRILNPSQSAPVSQVGEDNDLVQPVDRSVILNWGVCLPESCGSRDVQNLLTKGTLSAFQLPVASVVCFERDRDLGSDGWAVLAVCILSFAGGLVLICTILETAIYYEFIPSLQTGLAPVEKKLEKNGLSTESYPDSANNGIEKNGMKAAVANQKTPLNTDNRPKDMFGDGLQPRPRKGRLAAGTKDSNVSLGVQFLQAFSMRFNGTKIMSTRTTSEPDMVTCLQGMRVISISWIVLGHCYSLTISNPNNLMYTSAIDMPNTFSRLSFTFVAGANLAVDTFFVISGLLVMKMTLKELRRGRGQTVGFWVTFYLHRIWRLTPVYMMVLMTGTTLFDYIVDGPLKSETMLIFHSCDSHWWANLLYINNFYKRMEMCMIWSWYLAVDMQLFLISPIFILLVHRKYRFGLFVLVAAIILGWLTTFLLTLDYPGIFSTALFSANLDYLRYVYLVPWTRISVFAMGMLLAVILEDAPDQPIFSKVKALFIWMFLTGAAIFVLMIAHGEMEDPGNWPKGTMALYETLSRSVWSFYVAWIIYSCQSGLGGIAKDFLTWTGFQPLARLTYTVYLVHPMVLIFFTYERNSTIDLQDTVMINIFCGNLVMSYLVAALYSLLFEAPLLSLEKMLLRTK